MTVSDIRPGVRVRTRTHTGPESPVDNQKPARAPAIAQNDDVRVSDTPGTELEIVDHPVSISAADRANPGKSGHLADAGLSLAENYLAVTAPATIQQAWAGINGEPDEERSRGLAVVLLWLCGLVRAMALTVLWIFAIALFGTRRRTAGTIIVSGLLAGIYFICRALLP